MVITIVTSLLYILRCETWTAGHFGGLVVGSCYWGNLGRGTEGRSGDILGMGLRTPETYRKGGEGSCSFDGRLGPRRVWGGTE